MRAGPFRPAGTKAAGPRGPSPEFQCVETSPLGEQQSYTEVESGDSIKIEIAPDSRPTKLMATIFTHPGKVMVSGLLHLSTVERELVVDVPPGRYNVRLHAQWFEGGSRPRHKVNYVFGLRVPGEPELKGGCSSTAIGGIMGIVLESLDDPLRTAVDPINSRGCRYNIPIAKVRLVLEGSTEAVRYTETFHIDPPSLTIPLPVPGRCFIDKGGRSTSSRRILSQDRGCRRGWYGARP